MRNTQCAPRARTRTRRDIGRKPIFRSTTPASNVIRKDNAHLIEMALPGFSKKDISLEINEQTLTIKSTIEASSNEENYKWREFDYQGFERSFTLSKEADQENITANFKNGILAISIPDLPVVPAKKINIK